MPRKRKNRLPENDDVFIVEDYIDHTESDENGIEQETTHVDFDEKATINDTFRESLNSFSTNEIDEVIISDKKPKKHLSLVQMIALVCFSGVFIYSGIQIVEWVLDSFKANDYYTEMQEKFNSGSLVLSAKSSQKSIKTLSLLDMLGSDTNDIQFTTPELLSEYDDLIKKFNNELTSGRYKELDEFFGWIKVPGTRIDYPIMKSDISDPEKYLKRLPNGEDSGHGSVFADARTTDVLADNRHVVLYAHNKTDGSMFAAVEDFFRGTPQSAELFKTSVIQVVTREGIYIYKPFSIYRATRGNNYIRYEFADDDQWIQFIKDINSQNLYGYLAYDNIKFYKANTKILTFSTCQNLADPDGRYVLHTVLVSFIPNDN